MAPIQKRFPYAFLLLTIGLMGVLGCRHSGLEVVTLDNPRTFSVGLESIMTIPIRHEKGTLFTVYTLSAEARHSENSDFVVGHVRYTSSMNNNSVYEVFRDTGILLLYGSDFVLDAHHGCLEIRLLNSSRKTLSFEVTLRMTSFSWESPIILGTGLTMLAFLTVFLIARREHGDQALSGMFAAILPSWNMLKALLLVVVVELLSSFPGMVLGFRSYSDHFLSGNQDVCNFDFRDFYVYDISPALDSVISHYAYFLGATVILAVVHIESRSSCFCAQGQACWHWQLARISAVCLYFVGIRSIGYHLCPNADTVPLDYGGSASLAFAGLCLLYQQRKVSTLGLRGICIALLSIAMMAYLGSIYNSTLWFKVLGGFGALMGIYIHCRPLTRSTEGKKLVFDNALPAVYSSNVQMIAKMTEVVAGILVCLLFYFGYLSGEINFALAFDCVFICTMICTFIIELVLRIAHGHLSARATVASVAVLVNSAIGFHFFQVPNSEGGNGFEDSRLDSKPAIWGVFEPHDVWHVFSGIGTTALLLTILFFRDRVKRGNN